MVVEKALWCQYVGGLTLSPFGPVVRTQSKKKKGPRLPHPLEDAGFLFIVGTRVWFALPNI